MKIRLTGLGVADVLTTVPVWRRTNACNALIAWQRALRGEFVLCKVDSGYRVAAFGTKYGDPQVSLGMTYSVVPHVQHDYLDPVVDYWDAVGYPWGWRRTKKPYYMR